MGLGRHSTFGLQADLTCESSDDVQELDPTYVRQLDFRVHTNASRIRRTGSNRDKVASSPRWPSNRRYLVQPREGL